MSVVRPSLFCCLLAVVITGSSSCLAEQSTGSETRENVAQSNEPKDLPADTGDRPAARRPAAALLRPKYGVQHPDLDEAWAAYEAAVGKASEGIRAAINKQFDAAASKGNLDTAEKWRIIGEAFEQKGTLPTDEESPKEIRTATEAFTKAGSGLKKAYDEVITVLTKQALTDKGMLQKAQQVRGEWKSIAARAVLQPNPRTWTSLFDGVKTDGWGQGWGEKASVVENSLRLQGKDSGLQCTNMADGESLAVEARINVRRVDRPQARAKLGLSRCEQGSYWLEVDQQGKGVIAYWDEGKQRLRPIKEFKAVLRPGQSHLLRFERSGNQLTASIDGKEVATTLAPMPVLPAGKILIAVSGLTADFSDLRVIYFDVH